MMMMMMMIKINTKILVYLVSKIINVLLKKVLGSVMAKEFNCSLEVSEFELKSLYYVHFRTDNLGKGMNLLSLPAMG